MKRILFILILNYFFTLSTFAQYNFDIKGYINNKIEPLGKSNLKDNDTVILRFLNISKIDTAYIKNDSFEIKGQVPYPSIAMLEYKYGGFSFDIDNSRYEFYLSLVEDDSANREYRGEIKTKSVFYNKFDNLRKIRVPLNERKSLLQDSLQHTQSRDSMFFYATKIKEIDDSLIIIYDKFAKENPGSYLVAYAFPNIPDFSYKKYYLMYLSLPDSVKNSFYGRNFYSRLMATKNVEANEKNNEKEAELPTIIGIDTAFNNYTLNKNFYKRHRYSLIEFWASWCGPCRRINQDLIKKELLLKEKGVFLVGVSLDNSGESWKIAINEDKTNWLQISDLKAMESPVVKYLRLESIPFNVVVDANGKIIKQNIYGQELDNFLNSLH
ncbi:MAG: TlpA disulfide reductase family protein [Arachidicoccus sp.]|nr:TlpA disulfide reductase family protein [Arachidicoccus sp.]